MQEFMLPENLSTVLHLLQKARQERVGCPVDTETLCVELTKFAEMVDAIEAAERVCNRRDNSLEATHSNAAGELYKLNGGVWYKLDEVGGGWEYDCPSATDTPVGLHQLPFCPPPMAPGPEAGVNVADSEVVPCKHCGGLYTHPPFCPATPPVAAIDEPPMGGYVAPDRYLSDLTPQERRFCLLVLLSPGAKLQCLDENDDGSAAWERPQAMGLVEVVGSYKWRAVGLEIIPVRVTESGN